MERLCIDWEYLISIEERTLCYYNVYIYCVGGLIDRRFESSQSLRFTRRGHAMVMLAGEKIVTSAVRTMADSTCGPAIPATGNH